MHLHRNSTIIAAYIITRIVAVGTLWLVTGGREVASDVDFYRMMIESPLGIINGNLTQEVSSYAPLQFLYTYPAHRFFSSFLDDFWSYRLVMIAVEVAAAYLLFTILDMAEVPDNVAVFSKWLTVFSPSLVLTTSVFVQDEIISYFFVALALHSYLRSKPTLAIFSLTCGILLGKIFLIVPLFFVFLFLKVSVKTLAALVPLAAIYGLVVIAAVDKGGYLPLVGFSPGADYSSFLWVLLIQSQPNNLEAIKLFSLLSTALLQLLFFALFLYVRYFRDIPIRAETLVLVPLSGLFLTLYQHNAEYLILLIPAAYLYCSSKMEVLLLTTLLAFAWIPRVLHGLVGLGSTEASTFETRQQLLGPLFGPIQDSLPSIHHASIVCYSAFYFLALVVLWAKTRNRLGGR